MPHHPTNHSPSMGIYRTIRPITVLQWEYTAPSDQSQSSNGNILQAITLVGALLMIAGAHLSEKGVVITSDSAKQFKNDIFVLLAQPTGSLRHLREYLHRFVGEN
jgi:hypothetical protein